MSARIMPANWLAHDYLHIRQITRLRYDRLPEYVETFTIAVLPATGGSMLNAYWENTRLWVQFANQ